MGKCNHGHHRKADKWTKINTVGTGIASFISNAYWCGTFIDIAAGLEEKFLGLSWYGFAFGAFIALFPAASDAYFHTVLNINHQGQHNHHHDHSDDEASSKDQSWSQVMKLFIRLTWYQKLGVVGDLISHMGDKSGPVTFVISLATHNSLPRWGKILVQCSATLFGGVTSVGDARTCVASMAEYNATFPPTDSRPLL